MSAAIVKLMGELRTRPRARLQHPSLSRIDSYVGGYIWARAGSGISGENDLMLDFDEWLRLLFSTGFCGNAESIIALFAEDEAHAVQMYFDLFDDFITWRTTPEAQGAMSLRRRIHSSTTQYPRHDFPDLLQELRNRAGMYIGRRLLSRLMAFVRGFVAAHQETGLKEGKGLVDEFDRWVRCRYHTDVEHDAESLIVFHNLGDDTRIDPFWQLFDEFMRNRSPATG